ncbi:hypothetical protein BZG36_04262 [Bifiguratus adelaidae]|uniref:Mitochondrial inner membrane protease ATP23 n=1 Tax=Bifiguratus adelaidae TaxID=1938954 RepID=A0A261XVW5_9FUNG|nr:hypothetical protein BZG36_04262 [Bifiguratus adelaidae]
MQGPNGSAFKPEISRFRSSTLSETECTAELQEILDHDPKIQVLLHAIFNLNGRRTLVRGVTCRTCKGTTQQDKYGYYDGQYKRVVICCDNHRSKQEVRNTLIHELVHAFDASRKGAFDSIAHTVACGEVRASRMGQCADLPLEKQRQCVYEDAVRSTESYCDSTHTAMRVVSQVFDQCFADLAPFNSQDE